MSPDIPTINLYLFVLFMLAVVLITGRLDARRAKQSTINRKASK